MSLSRNAITALSDLYNGQAQLVAHWTLAAEARLVACESNDGAEPIVFSTTPRREENAEEKRLLCAAVQRKGFCVYEWQQAPPDPTQSVVTLLRSLSLHVGDGGVIRDAGELSLLQDCSGTPKGRFPPYQRNVIHWHTDGYYNALDNTVRCFTLHCVESATSGGALVLLDDTVVLYALLQHDAELFSLLAHPEAMTLPRNKDNLGHNRPDRHVPVIQKNHDSSLSLRFTTRTQNIQWRCAQTKSAALQLGELITNNTHWHHRVLLKQNQGIVTRNVIHMREPYEDAVGAAKRQMLRGRFNNLPTPATEPEHATR